jgi:hypothetical protein
MPSFFGILGGEKVIHNGGNLENCSGLELFGTEALVLGSGFKFGENNLTTNAEWKNSLSLSNNFISARSYDDQCKVFSNLHMNANSFVLSLNKDKSKSPQKRVDGIKLELNEKGNISLTESGLELTFGENKITIKDEKIEFTCKGQTINLLEKLTDIGRSALTVRDSE